MHCKDHRYLVSMVKILNITVPILRENDYKYTLFVTTQRAASQIKTWDTCMGSTVNVFPIRYHFPYAGQMRFGLKNDDQHDTRQLMRVILVVIFRVNYVLRGALLS